MKPAKSFRQDNEAAEAEAESAKQDTEAGDVASLSTGQVAGEW